MTQEDKELLLKDLCARLPYGVKLHKTYKECDSLELRSLDIGNDKLVFYTYKGEVLTICDTDDIERFGQIKYKPYLFPLSSMTEEHSIYMEKNKLIIAKSETEVIMNPDGYDFLNKNHYDYRGLIEKGLAIDATEMNVY
jgi:hypothetical protein